MVDIWKYLLDLKKMLQKYEQVACCPISRSVKQESCIEMRWRLSERGNKIKHCGKRETGTIMIWIRKISYIAIILQNFSSCFFMKIIYIKMVKYCCKSPCSENLFGDFPTEERDPIYVWWWHSAAGQPQTSQMRSLLSKKRGDLIIQAKWVFADIRSDSITASAFDVFGGLVAGWSIYN